MNFLLWMLVVLMGLALLPWINSKFPARQILLGGLLAVTSVVGGSPCENRMFSSLL